MEIFISIATEQSCAT